MEDFLNKKEIIGDRYNESSLISEINKKQFFDIFKKENIDFDKVVQKKKSYNEDYHRFNYMIKKMTTEGRMTMIDCAVYLAQDYFQVKNVLDCFNEENTYNLRHELANKHNIKMNKNILKYFLS